MSPGTGRPYALTMICEVWQVARSTVYAVWARGRGSESLEPKRRGPKTTLTDEELEGIHADRDLDDTDDVREMLDAFTSSGIELRHGFVAAFRTTVNIGLSHYFAHFIVTCDIGAEFVNLPQTGSVIFFLKHFLEFGQAE